jgi:hypothetical protein
VKLAEVASWMASQADVNVELRWGNPTWMVNGRMLSWHRSFSKADLRRFEEAGERPPTGDILAISVSSLAEKEAILFASLPGFFTISHFNGYPAVLVALASARTIDVVPVLERMRLHLLALPAKRARATGSGPKKAKGTTLTKATAQTATTKKASKKKATRWA